MTSSRLFDLPGDALDVICELIDGTDVEALLGTGCLVLRQKVLAAARNLRCQRSGFSGFPFSLYKLPQLRSLDVSIVKHQFGDHPLRLGGNLPLPTSPAPLLTSLSLSFAQSFRVLDASAPDLNTLLPHITELHLSNSRAVWTTEHLRKLPQTLRKLSLLTSAGFRETPENAVSPKFEVVDLSFLPASLEDVSLASFCVDDSDLESLVWPVGLRKLVILGVHNSEKIIYHLPPAVEHLIVEFWEGDQYDESEMLLLSSLPKTLRTFKLKSDFYRIDLDGGKYPLPPNIEVWDALTEWESLAAGKKDVEAAVRAYLPATLKKVELGSQGENWRVASIDLPSVYSFLPLHSLDWQGFCFGPHTRLPSTLTCLECSFTSLDQINALPSSSLTMLHIYELRVSPSAETWSHLASFLKTLITPALAIADSKKLLAGLRSSSARSKSLPLTQLHLTYPKVLDEEFVLCLPPTLTALKLFIAPEVEGNFDAINTSISHLSSHLPLLTTFSLITPYAGIPGLMKHRGFFSTKIPKSVTELELPYHREHMRILPPNLTILTMWTTAESKQMPSAEVGKLPKSLTSLTLKGLIERPNAEFWSLLHPTIHTIKNDLEHTTSEERRKYYSKPQWDGVFDPIEEE